MLKSKVTSLVLSALILSASSPSFAQTATKGKFSVVKKGDPTPIGGVVYDLLGNAAIITDKEQSEKNHKLELKKLRESLTAEKDRDVSALELSKKISEAGLNAQLTAITKELAKTRDIAVGTGSSVIWWAGGGFVVGVLTTVLITMAVKP